MEKNNDNVLNSINQISEQMAKDQIMNYYDHLQEEIERDMANIQGKFENEVAESFRNTMSHNSPFSKNNDQKSESENKNWAKSQRKSTINEQNANSNYGIEDKSIRKSISRSQSCSMKSKESKNINPFSCNESSKAKKTNSQSQNKNSPNEASSSDPVFSDNEKESKKGKDILKKKINSKNKSKSKNTKKDNPINRIKSFPRKKIFGRESTNSKKNTSLNKINENLEEEKDDSNSNNSNGNKNGKFIKISSIKHNSNNNSINNSNNNSAIFDFEDEDNNNNNNNKNNNNVYNKEKYNLYNAYIQKCNQNPIKTILFEKGNSNNNSQKINENNTSKEISENDINEDEYKNLRSSIRSHTRKFFSRQQTEKANLNKTTKVELDLKSKLLIDSFIKKNESENLMNENEKESESENENNIPPPNLKKGGGGNFRIIKKQFKNRKKWTDNFLKLENKRQKVKEAKLGRIKRVLEDKESEDLYFSPMLDNNSLQILNEKSDEYIPLFERAVEIENIKKVKLLMKQKMQQNKDSIIINNSSTNRKTKKEINDFFVAQMSWKDKIEKKNKKLKESIKQKNDEKTIDYSKYQLKIDPFSEYIINKKRNNSSVGKNKSKKSNNSSNGSKSNNNSNSNSNSSYLRLYKDYEKREKKLNSLKKKLTPTFHPYIIHKSKDIDSSDNNNKVDPIEFKNIERRESNFQTSKKNLLRKDTYEQIEENDKEFSGSMSGSRKNGNMKSRNVKGSKKIPFRVKKKSLSKNTWSRGRETNQISTRVDSRFNNNNNNIVGNSSRRHTMEKLFVSNMKLPKRKINNLTRNQSLSINSKQTYNSINKLKNLSQNIQSNKNNQSKNNIISNNNNNLNNSVNKISEIQSLNKSNSQPINFNYEKKEDTPLNIENNKNDRKSIRRKSVELNINLQMLQNTSANKIIVEKSKEETSKRRQSSKGKNSLSNSKKNNNIKNEEIIPKSKSIEKSISISKGKNIEEEHNSIKNNKKESLLSSNKKKSISNQKEKINISKESQSKSKNQIKSQSNSQSKKSNNQGKSQNKSKSSDKFESKSSLSQQNKKDSASFNSSNNKNLIHEINSKNDDKNKKKEKKEKKDIKDSSEKSHSNSNSNSNSKSNINPDNSMNSHSLLSDNLFSIRVENEKEKKKEEIKKQEEKKKKAKEKKPKKTILENYNLNDLDAQNSHVNFENMDSFDNSKLKDINNFFGGASWVKKLGIISNCERKQKVKYEGELGDDYQDKYNKNKNKIIEKNDNNNSENKLFNLNYGNSPCTSQIKPFTVTANEGIFYKYFMKKK